MNFALNLPNLPLLNLQSQLIQATELAEYYDSVKRAGTAGGWTYDDLHTAELLSHHFTVKAAHTRKLINLLEDAHTRKLINLLEDAPSAHPTHA